MARRHVGRAPIGGITALFCAILLFAPEVHGQVISRKMYTISGTVGLPGVSMKGLPNMPVTDENGVYTAEVGHGWTGVVTPVKTGYEFLPNEIRYDTPVKSNMTGEFTHKVLTFTISGSTGNLPGVRLNGFDSEVVSGENGRYKTEVPYGWTGTVTADLLGYRFEPAYHEYSQVKTNYENRNYKPTEVTFTISGSAQVPGVTMLVETPGQPSKQVTTGEGGRYSVDVRYGWSGKITPKKDGHQFTPESNEYSVVQQTLPGEDFSVVILHYDISGSAGMPNVVMKGFPVETVTNDIGFYTVSVPHGWSGKVTPDRPGFTFKPESIPYTNVTKGYETQDYNATEIYLDITGSTGLPDVVLTGLPGNVVSNEKGLYTAKVAYGFNGAIIPQKEGYTFEPADRSLVDLSQNVKQDFKPTPVFFELSGTVRLPGVTLKGLPGTVVSGADGAYSAKVSYGWKGTVTPVKSGYEFSPSERPYEDGVFVSQMNQDYFGQIMKYAISGKVMDKSGTPVEGVQITTQPPTEVVTTDASGAFELRVDHGWRGTLTTATNPAYILTPPTKSFQTGVFGNQANQAFSAEQKMLTITNVLKLGDEPISGVQVTAAPGNHQAKSDTSGKYTLRVPYGWSGELSFYHEEFNIEGTRSYEPVTEDIDETKPKPAARPPVTTPQTPMTTPQTPVGAQPPAGTQIRTTAQPPVGTQPPAGTQTQVGIPTGRELMLQQLTIINKELETLLSRIGSLDATEQRRMDELLAANDRLVRAISDGGQVPPTEVIPPVGQATLPVVREGVTPKLLSTLTELSRQTNTKIGVDATVKDEPVPVGVGSVQGLSVDMALEAILKGTKYTFEKAPDGTYLVFQPVSNNYTGTDILMALQDLHAETGVPIIPDPNIAGETYASFDNQPLERALGMILAGKPYVFIRTPHYYLVADRGARGPAFLDISSTRHIWVNHRTPAQIKAILPPMYADYVQAEVPDALDPNDQGHILTITAPSAMSDRIAAVIRSLDLPRRQVLLDTRVVVMERGDLLNLGVEWNFPKVRAGRALFEGDWLTGVQIGYSPDGSFTDSLMAALNLLQANSQADIVAHPQLISQDGRQAQLRSIQEEWFMMSDQQSANSLYGFARAELQKIESGTILTITPRVGDSNDIQLDMAVEVSDSIPKGAGSDLPVVTRRIAKNSVTVQDGGTVAVAGLTESRGRQVDKRVPFFSGLPLIGEAFKNKDQNKQSREVAVFVTAHIIREPGTVARGPSPEPLGIGGRPQPAGPEYTDQIRDALRNQTR